jgi:hypothetical protein
MKIFFVFIHRRFGLNGKLIVFEEFNRICVAAGSVSDVQHACQVFSP